MEAKHAMTKPGITFRQIYPLLSKNDIFVLIDNNGEATSYHPSGNRTAEIYPLLNRRVLSIYTFKWDIYCEDSYIGIRLDYNKQELLNE